MLNEGMRQFVYLGDTAAAYSEINTGQYFALDIDFVGFRSSMLKFLKPYF